MDANGYMSAKEFKSHEDRLRPVTMNERCPTCGSPWPPPATRSRWRLRQQLCGECGGEYLRLMARRARPDDTKPLSGRKDREMTDGNEAPPATEQDDIRGRINHLRDAMERQKELLDVIATKVGSGHPPFKKLAPPAHTANGVVAQLSYLQGLGELMVSRTTAIDKAL